MPGHGRRAGEQQVVERQAGEVSTDLRSTGDHGNLCGVEGRREDLRHDLRGCRRVLRRLDEAAVARREYPRQRRKGEVDGKVPGADDAHDPEGLVLDAGFGAEQIQRKGTGLALLRLHPALEVGLRVAQGANGPGNVREQGLVLAAMAEVLGHRCDEPLLMGLEQPDGALEAVPAQLC